MGADGALVPIEAQQEAIREIAALRAQGRSLRAIRDEMRAKGFEISHEGVARIVSRLEPECPLYGRIEPTDRSRGEVCQGPTRRSAHESAARLGHVLLDATPIFGAEPCEALLASPFRPRLGVRCG